MSPFLQTTSASDNPPTCGLVWRVLAWPKTFESHPPDILFAGGKWVNRKIVILARIRFGYLSGKHIRKYIFQNIEIVSASTFGQETGIRLPALTCSHSLMLVPIYQLIVADILLTATTSQGLAYNCEELPWGRGWAVHLVASLQESRAWNPPGLQGKKEQVETYDRKSKADQGIKVPVLKFQKRLAADCLGED